MRKGVILFIRVNLFEIEKIVKIENKMTNIIVTYIYIYLINTLFFIFFYLQNINNNNLVSIVQLVNTIRSNIEWLPNDLWNVVLF